MPTNQKHQITLTQAQETLLIPLYAKAVESRQPHPIFFDQKTLDILDQVKYDFSHLNVPRKTTLMVCMRASKLDDYTNNFLAEQPDTVVLHLGCGLDSRYLRINNSRVKWYDLDMPNVIDLRRKFYQETDKYHMIASSVTDHAWLDSLSPINRPVLVVAEGLLMYLREEDVKALFLKLKQTFSPCSIVFDAFSTLTAKSVKHQPSIKKTEAAVHWGIDNPADIEKWSEGIKFREEWFFSQSEIIQKLGTGYRLMFKLANLFPLANKAHRILYFTL
ncbi:MAG: class I SAM-dependent methyltransferase [Anaerolineales bacterium]|nr:class I SAM-dependent methyltransferase [Anaerolineales bacterium]